MNMAPRSSLFSGIVLTVLALALSGCVGGYTPRPPPPPPSNCDLARWQFNSLIVKVSPDGSRVVPRYDTPEGRQAVRAAQNKVFYYCGVFP